MPLDGKVFIELLNRDVDESELETISFDDLLKMNIAPGHLFFIPRKAKMPPICLLKGGGYIDKEWIVKYTNKGLRSFFCFVIKDDKKIKDGSALLKKLRISKNEEEAYLARNEFINWVKVFLWDGNDDISFLDLSLICMSVFFDLDEKVVTQIMDKSLVIYDRAQRVSALGVIVALILGYTDFDFLKDVYHACFLLDYGLCDDTIPFKVIEALEVERIKPGTGRDHLVASRASQSEIDLFLNHPKNGFEKVLVTCESKFKYPEVVKLILRHHENGMGTGFPLELLHDDLSEWETIPMFVDHLVSYAETLSKKGDARGFLKDQIDELKANTALDYLPCKRVFSRIEKEMCSNKSFELVTRVTNEDGILNIEPIGTEVEAEEEKAVGE